MDSKQKDFINSKLLLQLFHFQYNLNSCMSFQINLTQSSWIWFGATHYKSIQTTYANVSLAIQLESIRIHPISCTFIQISTLLKWVLVFIYCKSMQIELIPTTWTLLRQMLMYYLNTHQLNITRGKVSLSIKSLQISSF